MISAEKKYNLERMNSHSFKYGLGKSIDQCVGVVKGKYRFSVQGGAVGSVNLVDDDGVVVKLPSGAIVTKAYINIVQAMVSTGGTGTIAVSIQSAGDLLAAVDADTLSGVTAAIPVGTAATMIKLTAERTLTATVATAAITAGKFDVFVEFVLSE